MQLKPSILIVDDEPINLKLVAESLESEYQLHFALSAQEGLDFLKKNMVDLILLDIIMPDMNGFDMAKAVQDMNTGSKIPFIFLTADHSDETIERAFDAGAIDYIAKPFRSRELMARVKHAIQLELLIRKQQNLLAYNQHLMRIVDGYATNNAGNTEDE
mgnify:CR=1 FL=1